MADIVIFRFFLPIFMVILLALPMIGSAVDTKDVVQLAAREGARKAAVVYDANAVEKRVQDVITGSGKPLTKNGITLFDKTEDVSINWFDGDHVTVIVTYHHYLMTPRIFTLLGKGALDPTITMTQIASFEREW